MLVICKLPIPLLSNLIWCISLPYSDLPEYYDGCLETENAHYYDAHCFICWHLHFEFSVLPCLFALSHEQMVNTVWIGRKIAGRKLKCACGWGCCVKLINWRMPTGLWHIHTVQSVLMYQNCSIILFTWFVISLWPFCVCDIYCQKTTQLNDWQTILEYKTSPHMEPWRYVYVHLFIQQHTTQIYTYKRHVVPVEQKNNAHYSCTYAWS